MNPQRRPLSQGLLQGLLILAALPALAAPPRSASGGANWPSFRGLGARGIALGAPPPLTWNVPEKKNLRWRVPVPGLGHSSPVVWGNRIWVTSAVSSAGEAPLRPGLYGDIAPAADDLSQRWIVVCLDRRNGKVLWERTAHSGVPRTRRHPKATHANPTVATDGKRVVAFFGSEGLYCYDLAGRLRWKKDLGVLDAGYFAVPSAQWGFASSPVIHGDSVFIQCDVQGSGFLAAFRLADGGELWRAPRDDVPTWGTPTVFHDGARTQVVVNGYRHIGGYDARTGRELWRLRGGGDIPVPTPLVAQGLIFITNAHGRLAPIFAVRAAAEGDITPAEGQTTSAGVAWSHPRGGGYMQTPLVYGDHLYVCRDNGVLSCYEAKTGVRIYEERLGSGTTGFTASPVAAPGRLYFTGEDGEVRVVRAGPKFELLATNPLGEICLATPAISNGTLLFRGRSHLIAIGETRPR